MLLAKLEERQRKPALPKWNAVTQPTRPAVAAAELASVGARLMPSLAQSVAVIGPPQGAPSIKGMAGRLRP
jgi:hypothetical protein